MLSHTVFFTAKNRSQESVDVIVAAAHEHLTGHAGCVFYACGPRAAVYDRDVNDDEFDVCLNIVFDTRENHDVYQVADRHMQFIATAKEHWQQVRVFDADVSAG